MFFVTVEGDGMIVALMPTGARGVGVAGVWVPDMGSEEHDDPALGDGVGRQKRWSRSAPPAVRWRSRGKPAGPWMNQLPFHMNDNGLYHSWLVEAAIFEKSYNAGALPYVE